MFSCPFHLPEAARIPWPLTPSSVSKQAFIAPLCPLSYHSDPESPASSSVRGPGSYTRLSGRSEVISPSWGQLMSCLHSACTSSPLPGGLTDPHIPGIRMTHGFCHWACLVRAAFHVDSKDRGIDTDFVVSASGSGRAFLIRRCRGARAEQQDTARPSCPSGAPRVVRFPEQRTSSARQLLLLPILRNVFVLPLRVRGIFPGPR